MTRPALRLAAILCVLAGPAAAQDEAPTPLPSPPPASSANPNPLAGLTLETLSATRELPLFTPSRTAPVVESVAEPRPEPPPAEEPEPVEAAAEPPPLRLIGLVLTASEQVAILSNEGTGETQRLRPGEDYEGWTLEIVDARSVAFRNGDQLHTFKMFEPGSEPPAQPGARTPIPEEALANPPAMFGGQPSEGEFVEGTDPYIDPSTGLPIQGADPNAQEFDQLPAGEMPAGDEGQPGLEVPTPSQGGVPEGELTEEPIDDGTLRGTEGPLILDNSGEPQL